jgi:hypothetical protein
MKSIIAVDIDLGEITAWSNVHGVIQYHEPTLPEAAMRTHDVVLVETASPFIYSAAAKGELTNRLRWMIWNVALSEKASTIKPGILFAPSSVWSHGYKEPVREIMAGCSGKFNHDVRACICMVYFYGLSPGDWIPWSAHLDSLLKTASSKLKTIRTKKGPRAK